MGDRASTDVDPARSDDNSSMLATHRTAHIWAAECAALAGCSLLLIEGRGSMQPDRVSALGAATAFAVVLTGSILALVVRIAPPRLAPLLLALMVPGLIRSDSPLVAVLAFAAVVLVPIATLYAAGAWTSPWTTGALAVVSLVAFVARIFYRDPFHELRCAPACVPNPWLRANAPDLVRSSELALAAFTFLWAASAAAIHVRRGATAGARTASTSVVLAVAVLWAARLAQQPRPVPGDAVDRWLALGLIGSVAVAGALRARTPLD